MKLFIVYALLVLTFSISAIAQVTKETPVKTPLITDLVIEVEGGKSLRMKPVDLVKLPRKEVKAKDHSGVEATYTGVELREILVAAGAKLGKDLRGPMIAQFLVVEAADGYRAVYSLTELDPDFTDKTVILADLSDGKALDERHGPWQIIATNEKKHARWVRQVTALKVKIAK